MGGGGGGAAVKVAGKLSRIGNNGGVLKGIKSVLLSEQSISTTTAPNRSSSSWPVSSMVTTCPATEDGKSSVLVADSSVQRQPAWAIDDWEFAGVENEVFDSMNPMPRVVFGRVPTLEEAEEATSQLKEAFYTAYSSDATAVKESTQSVDYNSGYTESKACVTTNHNSIAGSSIPKPVFQAFSLLQKSPECQDAVASIASDKTVWEAVMRNQKVMDFIKSRQTSAVLTDNDMDDEKSSDCGSNVVDEKHHEEDSANGLTEFIEKIKVAVTEFSSNLYGVVFNIFGGPTEENMSLNSEGSSTAAYIEKTTGASLFALAVMAIMVVVLKRV